MGGASAHNVRFFLSPRRWGAKAHFLRRQSIKRTGILANLTGSALPKQSGKP